MPFHLQETWGDSCWHETMNLYKMFIIIAKDVAELRRMSKIQFEMFLLAKQLWLHSVCVQAYIRLVNLLLLDTLPTCQIWQKNIPPFPRTPLTIGFHASTCFFVQIPGVSLYLECIQGNMKHVIFKNDKIAKKKLNMTNEISRSHSLRVWHTHPWAVSETPVASAIKRPPLVVLCW
jgi:hypothetical protein